MIFRKSHKKILKALKKLRAGKNEVTWSNMYANIYKKLQNKPKNIKYHKSHSKHDNTVLNTKIVDKTKIFKQKDIKCAIDHNNRSLLMKH